MGVLLSKGEAACRCALPEWRLGLQGYDLTRSVAAAGWQVKDAAQHGLVDGAKTLHPVHQQAGCPQRSCLPEKASGRPAAPIATAGGSPTRFPAPAGRRYPQIE